MNSMQRLAAMSALAVGVVAGVHTAAEAGTTIVPDQYYGGVNTYNASDVIGSASVFDIQSAEFQRIGINGQTLQVTINTNFAGVPGTAAADGTGYGALFLTPGFDSWHPVGPAPYANDTYTPGEWTYAFTIPQVPSTSTGTGGLYAVSDGVVQMSNVGGDTITYPYPGNPGYYFRQGQAVQFTPNSGASALAGGSWSVGQNQLVFNIDDNHLLGNSFSFGWAMTCGNDVIQGMVSGVPEPSTWAIMLLGFFGLGALLRRKRAVTQAATAA